MNNLGLSPKQEEIVIKVVAERHYQDQEWGSQRQNIPGDWMFILIEELGEASECFLDNDRKNAIKELIQAQAVIMCWIECEMDRIKEGE